MRMYDSNEDSSTTLIPSNEAYTLRVFFGLFDSVEVWVYASMRVLRLPTPDTID